MGFNPFKVVGKIGKGVAKVGQWAVSPYHSAAALATKRKPLDFALPTAQLAGGIMTGNPALIGSGAYGLVKTVTGPKKTIYEEAPASPDAGGGSPAAFWGQGQNSGAGSSEPLMTPMPSSPANMYDFNSFMQNGGGRDYSTPNQALIAQYSQPSPEEQRNMQGVTDLARLMGGEGAGLYNVSNPTFERAMRYYGDILSGNKSAVTSAIAPEAEMMAELTGAQQKGIEQSGLRGGARDAALAESARTGTGQIAGLIPKARANAAQAGGALSLSGIGQGTQNVAAGAGLYQNLAGMQQQNRQFGITAEQQNRFQAAGLDQQSKQLQLQAMLGMRGLDLQQMQLAVNERLQSRGLDLQEMLGMNSLALQRELGLAGINLSRQQIDLLKQQMANEAEAARGQAYADLGGIFMTGLGMLLPSGGGPKIGGPQQLPINPLGSGLNTLAGG